MRIDNGKSDALTIASFVSCSSVITPSCKQCSGQLFELTEATRGCLITYRDNEQDKIFGVRILHRMVGNFCSFVDHRPKQGWPSKRNSVKSRGVGRHDAFSSNYLW
jgi:hypothetical protein